MVESGQKLKQIWRNGTHIPHTRLQPHVTGSGQCSQFIAIIAINKVRCSRGLKLGRLLKPVSRFDNTVAPVRPCSGRVALKTIANILTCGAARVTGGPDGTSRVSPGRGKTPLDTERAICRQANHVANVAVRPTNERTRRYYVNRRGLPSADYIYSVLATRRNNRAFSPVV